MTPKRAAIVSVFLAWVSVSALAQEQAKKIPKIEVLNSPVSGKRMIFIDKKPFVILGAFNVQKAEDLDAVKAVGINTLCIEVPWKEEKAAYEKLYALARAAGEKELWVVLSLALVPPPQANDPTVAISPLNRPYSKLVQAQVQYVVDYFKSLPNLLGYATQDTPGILAKSNYSDAEFQVYLRNFYNLPQNLSQAWQYEIPNFEAATMQVAQTLDYNRSPVHFARPSVDICLYKGEVLSELMRLWAQQIKSFDKTHLVFTGRLNDYKSIMCVPENYDVVLPATLPTVAEPDTVAHNPHAVDMARHGNLFAATPVLLSSGGQGVLNAAIKQQLSHWMHMAFLHGASGVWFSNWEGLRDNLDTTKKADDQDSPLAKEFKNLVQSGIAESMPRPTVAYLYEPFGEGLIDATGNSLYGFAERLSLDEPNHPFFDFRGGTRFGQVDYLSHDDLTRVDLSQYRVIFAPQCLWLTSQTEESLGQFVNAGGVLVADLGIGMCPTGGTFVYIPPVMQQVFGVWTIINLNDLNRNMEIVTEHPLFPSLQSGMITTGVGENGMAFIRPLGAVRLYGDAQPFGRLVIRRHGRSPIEMPVHAYGQGFGVFAPFRLWPFWRPEDEVYQRFHADLVQRGGIVALNNEPRLFPTAVSVAAFSDGVGACNFSNELRYASVSHAGMSDLLYTNALTAVAPLQGTASPLLSGLGALPPALAQVLDRAVPEVATLHLDLKPGEMRYCHYLPIQLEPQERFAMARVVRYDKDQIELTVFGGANVLGIDQAGVLKMSNPSLVGARLTIYPGEYEIAPHSQHRFVIVNNTKDKKTESKMISADERGRLVFDGKFQSQTITISKGE